MQEVIFKMSKRKTFKIMKLNKIMKIEKIIEINKIIIINRILRVNRFIYNTNNFCQNRVDY